MKSIRVFLIIVILSILTLALFLSALNGYQKSLISAEQIFDNELINKTLLLAFIFEHQQPSKKRSPSSLNQDTSHFIFQIWRDNQLILKSIKAPDKAIATFKEGFQKNNILDYRWQTYRFYHSQENFWVLGAERIDIRYILAEKLILETIIPVMIMLPLLGLCIWLIVSYGLFPLKKLSITLESKEIKDLQPLVIDKQPAELKQLIYAINHLFARLDASFQHEKNFSSDAAHELRTPISAIKIHLYNLSQKVSDDPHYQQLQLAVERMAHLIEQILDFNRTSPEQVIARFNAVDIYLLSQSLIAEKYQDFANKSLQISLEGENALVDGDQFALEMLIQNLLSNAYKYTPENGEVRVLIIQSNTHITLEIHDTGAGIAEDKRVRIFDRFYRLDGDCHTSQITGCGLGLAIVKRIVELHNGKIELKQSELLGGLRVCVQFVKNKS